MHPAFRYRHTVFTCLCIYMYCVMCTVYSGTCTGTYYDTILLVCSDWSVLAYVVWVEQCVLYVRLCLIKGGLGMLFQYPTKTAPYYV